MTRYANKINANDKIWRNLQINFAQDLNGIHSTKDCFFWKKLLKGFSFIKISVCPKQCDTSVKYKINSSERVKHGRVDYWKPFFALLCNFLCRTGCQYNCFLYWEPAFIMITGELSLQYLLSQMEQSSLGTFNSTNQSGFLNTAGSSRVQTSC